MSKFTFDKLVTGLKTKQFKNIAVMSGAGLSVSAGIPDFRSPGFGLYANLDQFNLPYPEAIFEIKYFQKNPQAYYTFVSNAVQSGATDTATPGHFFMRFL